jgi:hypothetical protein
MRGADAAVGATLMVATIVAHAGRPAQLRSRHEYRDIPVPEMGGRGRLTGTPAAPNPVRPARNPAPPMAGIACAEYDRSVMAIHSNPCPPG